MAYRRQLAKASEMPRGGKAKAPEIKAQEGNRAKRGRKAIPQPVKLKGRPVMPTNFEQGEKSRWTFVITAMPVDLLKKADSPILERFVRAWHRYDQIQDAIKRHGLLIDGEDKKAVPTPNPLIRIAMLYAKEMDTCGAQIGLSPTARTRLAGSNDLEDEDDIMSALLGADGDPNGAWFSEPKLKQ